MHAGHRAEQECDEVEGVAAVVDDDPATGDAPARVPATGHVDVAGEVDLEGERLTDGAPSDQAPGGHQIVDVSELRRQQQVLSRPRRRLHHVHGSRSLCGQRFLAQHVEAMPERRDGERGMLRRRGGDADGVERDPVEQGCRVRVGSKPFRAGRLHDARRRITHRGDLDSGHRAPGVEMDPTGAAEPDDPDPHALAVPHEASRGSPIRWRTQRALTIVAVNTRSPTCAITASPIWSFDLPNRRVPSCMGSSRTR